MMNLEDFVDMEWVEDSATNDPPASSDMMLSNDFYLPFQMQQQQQPLTPPTMNMTVEQQNADLMKLDTLPSTEQIKQLIEIAKQQLALREQLQQLQQQQQQQQLFQTLSNTSTSAAATATSTEQETQTAAPSTIFAPPPAGEKKPSTSATTDNNGVLPPLLSPSSITSTEMVLPAPVITAFEEADIAVKTEMTPTPSLNQDSVMADNCGSSSDSINGCSNSSSGGNRQKGSLSHFPEEHLSLEAYAEADGIDLKKLTPKERRQLRNKISARNFRVRRKEYITTLEGQVNDHKMAAEALRERLKQVEDENKKLRLEMDSLKKQNQQLLQQQQQQQQAQQTQPKQNSTTSTAVSSPRISSPLPKPNLNKDISILGTKATDSYRQQEHCILVSNAVMPNWDYDTILHQKISTASTTSNKEAPHLSETMKMIIGSFLLSFVQLANTMPTTTRTNGTNQKHQNNNDVITDTTHHNKPLMPEDRDFTSSNVATKDKKHQQKKKSRYMEYLYDVLIQSSLINSSNNDQKSFWWWDNASNHHHQHPRAA